MLKTAICQGVASVQRSPLYRLQGGYCEWRSSGTLGKEEAMTTEQADERAEETDATSSEDIDAPSTKFCDREAPTRAKSAAGGGQAKRGKGSNRTF